MRAPSCRTCNHVACWSVWYVPTFLSLIFSDVIKVFPLLQSKRSNVFLHFCGDDVSTFVVLKYSFHPQFHIVQWVPFWYCQKPRCNTLLFLETHYLLIQLSVSVQWVSPLERPPSAPVFEQTADCPLRYISAKQSWNMFMIDDEKRRHEKKKNQPKYFFGTNHNTSRILPQSEWWDGGCDSAPLTADMQGMHASTLPVTAVRSSWKLPLLAVEKQWRHAWMTRYYPLISALSSWSIKLKYPEQM